MDPITNIKEAMKKVDKGYSLIQRYNNIEPAKRERAYCYELYHQMRLLDNFGDFTIHGEIDKRGDSSFNKSNPDFVIHRPGTKDNYITIEVKVTCELGKFNDIKEVLDDLIQLQYMIDVHNYLYGIFILISYDMNHFKAALKKMMRLKSNLAFRENIYVICQKDPQSEPQSKPLFVLKKEVETACQL